MLSGAETPRTAKPLCNTCAVAATKAPHPLHLHMSNLGLAGNVDTALATIEAAQGVPLHLAHAQFYAYAAVDRENPLTGGFASAAIAIIASCQDTPLARSRAHARSVYPTRE